MKIAIVAPPFLPIPPPNYGGTEKIVYHLVEGLVKKNFDVTLYASGDSQTSAKLIPTVEKSLGNTGFVQNEYLSQLRSYIRPFKEHKQYDIIHNHGQYLPLFLADLVDTPAVHTWHGSFYKGEVSEDKRNALQAMKHQKYISISDNQQGALPELNYVGRVYNGLDLNLYPYYEGKKGEYLVWVGRITAKKGPKAAIMAAKKAGIPIQLSATIDPIEQTFFDTEIKPLIDNKNVIYHGELQLPELVRLYQHALCTLFPVHWHEPFGLVIAESMACGTPVIGYNMGSVPEIIKDGETGYVVNLSDGDVTGEFITKETDAEGLYSAIQKIVSMPDTEYLQMRRAAHARVATNFTIDHMVEGYIAIYKKIVTIAI